MILSFITSMLPSLYDYMECFFHNVFQVLPGCKRPYKGSKSTNFDSFYSSPCVCLSVFREICSQE